MTDISTQLFSSKTLVSEGEKGAVWNVRPFQLVSLLEMLEHNAQLFYLATRKLSELQRTIELEIKERSGMSTLTDSEIDYTNSILDDIGRACQPLQLRSVLSKLGRFNNLHFQPLRAAPFNLEQLRVELDNLVEEITSALSHNKFMMIPESDAEYYDQPKLFGDEVYTNFESTRNDVLEAGNCFATGRYTACVFHCMRVLEKGLHALTYDLQNRFNAQVKLSKTVEETNWGTIIDEIQLALTKPNRIAVMNPKPTSSDMNFYSKATREFDSFNDAWRKDVSHSRRSYDENEAKAVMEHVKAFMQQISIRLKE